VDLPVPQPKANEAVVKLAASGVNFIDVYFREGRYKAPLPVVLGQEGAGAGVTAVGADAKALKVGDRVAWSGLQGSYAEYAAVAADRLVTIPAGVSDQQAAAAMLQGMTAHYLSHDTYPLKSGETALVHAAAGGGGLLLVQMAHNIGARVIATVSTDEKAKAGARSRGRRNYSLHAIRFRSRDKAPDWRQRRRRGLRFGRENDVRERAQYSSAPRIHGAVRRIERRGASIRFDRALPEGIPVCNASYAYELHCHSGRADGAIERGVWHDSRRQAQAADRAQVSARRSAARAPRSGRKKDDGQAAADTVAPASCRLSRGRPAHGASRHAEARRF